MNILVGQSGGPTAVINASLFGVIAEGLASSRIDTVYGMVHGIEGFLNGQIVNLTEYAQSVRIDLLKSTPASFLGSCRYKLPEDLNSPVYPELFARFAKMQIDAFFYIGGNDSMDTVDKLSRYAETIQSPIRILGIPKTIDNDLVLTDHTPGFGSTAKYAAATVRNIIWDAGVYDHPVVTIVELMGRNAGWVTAASVLARTKHDRNPYLIYLPEVDFDTEHFLEDVKEALQQTNSLVVCVSEGLHDAEGRFLCESAGEAVLDQFGHKMMTGCGKILEQIVRDRIGCKVRSIEINLPQRCSGAMSSLTDTTEAETAGRYAVQAAILGSTGCMVSFHRAPGEAYAVTCELIPVGDVCNKEKKFPLEWIKNGNDIDEAFLSYVLPLIQGETPITYENGLPKLLTPIYMK